MGDLLQQRVAGLVAQRIVDRLEPVEVEQEQRGRAIGADGLVEALVERGAHALAIGEPGQPVVKRQPGDLRFGAALLGQIGAGADKPLEAAIIVDHRPARDRPPALHPGTDSGTHRIIGKTRARRQMETQRPLGARRGGIHLEQFGQRPPDRRVIRFRHYICHLLRQIGQPAVAVGLPEPAGALRLELAHQPLGHHTIAGVTEVLLRLRHVEQRHAPHRHAQNEQATAGNPCAGAGTGQQEHHSRHRRTEAEQRRAQGVQRDAGSGNGAQNGNGRCHMGIAGRQMLDFPQQRAVHHGLRHASNDGEPDLLLGGAVPQPQQDGHGQPKHNQHPRLHEHAADVLHILGQKRIGAHGERRADVREQRKRPDHRQLAHLAVEVDGFGRAVAARQTKRFPQGALLGALAKGSGRMGHCFSYQTTFNQRLNLNGLTKC